MNMETALSDLGVHHDTLTQSDRANLDREGYMIVPNVLSAAQAAEIAARLDAVAAAEGENAGKDFQVEKGATRLGTLINKDPIFDICFLHPLGLAAVNYIMQGDFGLSSITGRAARPGEGLQALHRDNETLDSANVLWAVSDFTPENGPTRLIPYSHLFSTAPRQSMADPIARHPDEIYVIVPAGAMIVINGRTWHGGTNNTTARPRHLVSAFFLPRGRYQTDSHRKLTTASHQRLGESARFVIDHEYPDAGH
ncbi:MAG: phytanoyl-CoA dioxygenase family protein [Chthoniobacteraceae bacterium]